MDPAKIGPKSFSNVDLAVSRLPQQEVGDAQLTAGAHEQIQIRKLSCVEFIRDALFRDLIGRIALIESADAQPRGRHP